MVEGLRRIVAFFGYILFVITSARNLPEEVYQCIAQQLESAHKNKESELCSACYMKDLCSLSLTSRKWQKSAQEAMYQKIWVPLSDQPLQPKKLKLKSSTRLKRLCRTLHQKPHVAGLVKELRVSAQDRAVLDAVAKDKDSAFELLSSLVAACPNLRKLTGFYPSYGHIADSLVIELHRTTKLKEHAWIMGPKKLSPAQSIIQGTAPRGLPSPAQTSAFVSRHAGWSSLQTLVLGSDDGRIGSEAIYATLRRLPSVRHLCISNFVTEDFNDDTIHGLPILYSLRLENLPGVTDRGLSYLAEPRMLRSMRKIIFINLEFVSAPLVSRILANARYLTKFSLTQDNMPELPFGAALSQPFFASPRLRFLHWDIPEPGAAQGLLADSIKAGGFPSLRFIRAPVDEDGKLQRLCRPLAGIAQPSDYEVAVADLSQTDPSTKAASDPYKALNIRKLSIARLMAQKRIEEARKRPATRVVIEEEGVVRGSHTLRSYMGILGSKIEYILRPDVDGDEKAIADVGELLRGDTTLGNEMCSGAPSGKRGGHSTRRTERLVGLEMLF
ncbi:MAG: hypothetical protein Q9165_001143 [Trypethelium subeluteriae]